MKMYIYRRIALVAHFFLLNIGQVVHMFMVYMGEGNILFQYITRTNRLKDRYTTFHKNFMKCIVIMTMFIISDLYRRHMT